MLIVEIKSKNKTFASVVIYFNPDGKVLLLKRKKNSDFAAGQWGLVGGRADPDESIKDVAIRETFEESGLKTLPEDLIKVATIRSQTSPPVHVFSCKNFEGTVQMKNVSTEHDDYRWVGLKEVSEYDTAPHTLDLIQKAISMF